jgi:predicted  nucleic acid-binding Zn-ribbon protein
MSGLWFTKEQIEAEENAGRFNSPWDERSFRSRILQDWLAMYAEIATVRAELQAVEADLSICQDGNVGLLSENHDLKKQAYALNAELQRLGTELERLREINKNLFTAAADFTLAVTRQMQKEG